VQPQRLEGMLSGEAERLQHEALAGISVADPVADLAGLSDAVADVAERDAATSARLAFSKMKKGSAVPPAWSST